MKEIQIMQNFFRRWMPMRPGAFFAVVCITWLGLTGTSFACRCGFTVQTGFLHQNKPASANSSVSPLHLPANARGVLYLGRLPRNAIWGSDRADGLLIREIPAPLTRDSFSISEGANKLPVVVERLDIEEQIETERLRYFKFSDTTAEECYRKRYENLTCSNANQFEDDLWMKKFLAAGKLKDLTQAVKRANGLFRIGPAGGFQEGRTYTIRHLSSKQEVFAEISVVIDAPMTIPANEPFVLAKEGVAQATLLSFPASGSCGRNASVIVQNVRYVVPPAYEKYRQSLLFFTQQKHSADQQRERLASGRFSPYAYRPSLCSQVPFGGSLVGAGKELFATACDLGQRRDIEVRGFAGLLEVEDKLQPTPILKIDFAANKQATCDSFGILQNAIESKDVEKIRHVLCAIPRAWSRGDEPSKEMLPLLSKLARNPHARIRSCASGAVVTLAQRLKSLDATTAKAIVSAIRPNLADPDPMTRVMSVDSINEFARRIYAKKHEGQDIAGVDLSLFVPLVPDLSKVLVKDGSQSASMTLSMMGPLAKDAVPILLKAINSKQSYILSTLAAVGPKDRRVLAALRRLAEKGDYEDANIAYARAIQDTDMPAAVATLMKAVQHDSLFALWRLAELGPKAQAAIPLLLKKANSSRLHYMRSTAMETLIKVGCDDRSLLAVITHNLAYTPPTPKHSAEDMQDLRNDAIRTLGMMGTRGKPAIPQLLKVLDAAPTEKEYPSLIETLQEIGASKDIVIKALQFGTRSKSERIRDYAAAKMKEIEERKKK